MIASYKNRSNRNECPTVGLKVINAPVQEKQFLNLNIRLKNLGE